MWDLTPINFKEWIGGHRELLTPPVGNKPIYTDTGFVVQVVESLNSRKDFHNGPSEEFFYMTEGDMILKTMQHDKPVDTPIREGEPHLPHSPQRQADTVELVIERPRQLDEQDGLLSFREKCHNKPAEFERRRRPETEAIAGMALENYTEMRNTVHDSRFHLQKKLGLRLGKNRPGIFVPRYCMVMFHDLPYSDARRRGVTQQTILDTLTHNENPIEEMNFAPADRLVTKKFGNAAVKA